MRFSFLLVASAATFVAAAPHQKRYTGDPTPGTDKLAIQGLVNLAKHEFTSGSIPTCNVWNSNKRVEWNTFSNSQKTAYINAVLCLQSQPAQSDPAFCPGCKSRYDDFVATHINQTLYIHGTGNFLSWHRYFTWAYENALRTQCGYTGYQPYLNWGKLASNPLGAPVFDGTATSMSGNGVYEPHTPAYIPSPAAPEITLLPGSGGGCVSSGPFVNMQVNLGPVSPANNLTTAQPVVQGVVQGLEPNPRCLRRDISTYAANIALTDANSTALITQNTDIMSFQTVMQGNFAAGLLGVHTAGHFLVGGDPGGDIFTSPGDPYFFLHHAQIDRTWWIWQNQDIANRQNAMEGPTFILGGGVTSPTDILNLGTLAPPITIAQALSTTAGPFCYIYL